MNASLAELQGYLVLAVRGLGFPASHGTELASAIAYIPDEFEWSELTRALAEPFAPDDFRVIRDMPSLLDLVVSGENCAIPDPDAPILLKAYLDASAQAHGSQITCHEEGDGRLHVAMQDETPTTDLPRLRFEIPGPIYTALTDLAARMYVPESDASREKGAGAGLTDND